MSFQPPKPPLDMPFGGARMQAGAAPTPPPGPPDPTPKPAPARTGIPQWVGLALTIAMVVLSEAQVLIPQLPRSEGVFIGGLIIGGLLIVIPQIQNLLTQTASVALGLYFSHIERLAHPPVTLTPAIGMVSEPKVARGTGKRRPSNA